MERVEFVKRLQSAMLKLAARIGAVVPQGALTVWLEDLQSYPIEQVEAAIAEVGKEYTFSNWPPIALVLKKLEGDVELEAEREWRRCLDAMRCGEWSKVPGITREAAKLLSGGKPFGFWDVAEREFYRRRFTKIYKSLKQERHLAARAIEGPKEDALPLPNADNIAKRFPTE